VLRYLWATGIVAGGTLAAEVLYRTLDTTRLSMVFLAAVLLAALQLGRGPALLSALLAFLIYNFYLVEPRFTLQFASAEDFLTLVLFLGVALGTGSLAGRVRDEVLQRRSRERTLSTLFDASRLMSATENEQVLRERIAEVVASAAQGFAVVIGDDGVQHASGAIEEETEATATARELAKSAMFKASNLTQRSGLWRSRAIKADDRIFGAVVWRPAADLNHRGAEVEKLIDVLVDLGAAAIARAWLSSVKAEMDAVTQAERLRTALLSSISHDFRTPLATILASASSLLEYDDKLEAAVRRDLLENIQEEVERLNRFVANLLNMTRLESGVLEVRTEPVLVREVIDRVLHRLERRSGGRKLTQLISVRDLKVQADPVLIEQALTNIAENAVSYSPEASEVTVWANEMDGQVVIDISDEGLGVPARDQARIFDKFYRVAQAGPAPQGAGLGLSIARGLIEAMGGQVRAAGRSDGRAGLSVELRLPKVLTA
jgi:two-component system sensor histidine kinase KdpD